MIYTCSYCSFTFSRLGKVDECPACGKAVVREATNEEIEKYQKNRDENMKS
jgi:rRNA maturation endonuclease Nob1